MYGVIALEWIKGSGRFTPRPLPWVARLTGFDKQFVFARQFVRATYDYTYARKSGGRGIYLYFALPPGVYEVFEVLSWKHDQRYFVEVSGDGAVHERTLEETIECLTNVASESAS